MSLAPKTSIERGNSASSVLAEFGRPYWFFGNSLEDDVWKIMMHDEELERRIDTTLRFDHPMFLSGQSMREGGRMNDLYTCKIAMSCAMDPDKGFVKSAKNASQLHMAFLNMVRWKDDQDIVNFSDLTRGNYLEYIDELAEGGIHKLIAVEARVDRLLEIISSTDFDISTYDDFGRLRSNSLVGLVGLGSRGQVPAPQWERVAKLVQDRWPKLECNHTPRNNAAYKGGSASRVRSAVAVWEHLWCYRDNLHHDPIEFRALLPHETIDSVSNSIVKPEYNTRTLPPPEKVCELAARAIEFIVTGKNEIIDFHRSIVVSYEPVASYYKANSQAKISAVERSVSAICLNDAVNSHFNYWRNGDDGTWYSLNYRMLRFFNGSVIGGSIIAASTFLARRPNEINSMKTRAITSFDNGHYTVTHLASKTEGDMKTIPAPRTVAVTFELLEAIGEGPGNEAGWLLSIQNPITGKAAPSPCVNRAVNMFAEAAGVLLPNGERWSAYHQRHFFATVYYYRFKYPWLDALSQFLGHSGMERTRYYVHSHIAGDRLNWAEAQHAKRRVNEAKQAREDFERVRVQHIKDSVTEAFDDPGSMTGIGGKAWKREIEQMILAIEPGIAVNELDSAHPSFDQVLSVWIIGKWLEPHPEGHSYCKCGLDAADLSAAACLAEAMEKDGELPLLGKSVANATDMVCSLCPHNVQFRALQGKWEGIHARAKAGVEAATDEISRKVSEERERRIREHIRRYFGIGEA